jgi:hypothetical protein
MTMIDLLVVRGEGRLRNIVDIFGTLGRGRREGVQEGREYKRGCSWF